MWHPSPEELARLVDEPPTAIEAEHLAGCADCATELHAMQAERDALAALPRILPVPTSWDGMRHRLERAGMLAGRTGRMTWMPGIAAAFALFLAGGATGLAFANGWNGSRDVAVASDPVTAPATDARRTMFDLGQIDVAPSHDAQSESAHESTASQPPPAKLPAVERGARARERLRMASNDDLPSWDTIAARASRARTPDEAARYMHDAEGAYLAAMTRLAELTSTQSSDPAVRLATLDGIVLTTGAALERAPADPVINGYHLAARAQRDALLRTVSSSPEQDPWY